MATNPETTDSPIALAARDMETETGAANRPDFLDRLSADFDVQRGEAERLIGQLIKEGMVYEPRTGYLKKT